MRVLGLDPGLRHTGWGIIDVAGNRLRHVADGTVNSSAKAPLHERLAELHDGLVEIIERLAPHEAAVEETFVNRDARATLKLGHARGIGLLAPALSGLVISEYAPNQIKKTVVGAGHAGKEQIQAMVRHLLPLAAPETNDEADALAVAITHAHHRASLRMTEAAGIGVRAT